MALIVIIVFRFTFDTCCLQISIKRKTEKEDYLTINAICVCVCVCVCVLLFDSTSTELLDRYAVHIRPLWAMSHVQLIAWVLIKNNTSCYRFHRCQFSPTTQLPTVPTFVGIHRLPSSLTFIHSIASCVGR